MGFPNRIKLIDLFSEQDFVNLKQVRKYMRKIHMGEELEPVKVDFCPIIEKHYLSDGNHKAQAYRFSGFDDIGCEIKPCTLTGCNKDICSSYTLPLLEVRIRR